MNTLAWCFLLAGVLALPFAMGYGAEKQRDIEAARFEGQISKSTN